MSQMHTASPELARLSGLAAGFAPFEGVFELRIPGVHVSRAHRVQKEMHHAVIRPALCLVAQGAKRVVLGKDVYEYDASRMLVYSMDVPVTTQVTQASLDAPYLGLRLDLDPERIAGLAAKVYPRGLSASADAAAVCVDQVDEPVINAVARLLELASRPDEAELIAPLVLDEILIRLLKSPLGRRLAMIGLEDSRLHRVSRAVSWVRSHFDKPLDVERLATLAHMSPSSFHQHFKAVTKLSPLQYQKALRLQEARRLMLLSKIDAGSAGRQVGYLSASQFTREYGRYFGNPPTKDIAQLLEKAGIGAPPTAG